MDPEKDIKEDYIDHPVNHLLHKDAIQIPKQNPWRIAFLILLFIFVVTVGFFRSGFFTRKDNVIEVIVNPTLTPIQISPIITTIEENSGKQFCGGIAGIPCPTGFTCKLDGAYPDAGGICIEEPAKCTPYTNPCDPQSCDYDPQKCH